MKGTAVSFILFSVVLFSLGTEASANGGVIHFKGQIVNVGCDVQSLSDKRSFKDMQQVRVSSQITLAVNTYHNACSDIVPFSAVYTPLASATTADGRVSIDKDSNSGVVTLTYQ